MLYTRTPKIKRKIGSKTGINWENPSNDEVLEFQDEFIKACVKDVPKELKEDFKKQTGKNFDKNKHIAEIEDEIYEELVAHFFSDLQGAESGTQ